MDNPERQPQGVWTFSDDHQSHPVLAQSAIARPHQNIGVRARKNRRSLRAQRYTNTQILRSHLERDGRTRASIHTDNVGAAVLVLRREAGHSFSPGTDSYTAANSAKRKTASLAASPPFDQVFLSPRPAMNSRRRRQIIICPSRARGRIARPSRAPLLARFCSEALEDLCAVHLRHVTIGRDVACSPPYRERRPAGARG
jgi:hypothetical protein